MLDRTCPPPPLLSDMQIEYNVNWVLQCCDIIRTDDPILGIRTLVFRGIRSNHGARYKPHAPFAPRMDGSPFQDRLWHLPVGLCGCSDKPAHCHDVGYLSTHSGLYASGTLIFVCLFLVFVLSTHHHPPTESTIPQFAPPQTRLTVMRLNNNNTVNGTTS